MGKTHIAEDMDKNVNSAVVLRNPKLEQIKSPSKWNKLTSCVICLKISEVQLHTTTWMILRIFHENKQVVEEDIFFFFKN